MGFALPNCEDSPPHNLKLSGLSPIASLVGVELRQPVFGPRFRRTADPATVAVPKTAMNEDRLLAAGENDIGLTGQILRVQSISVPETVK